MLDNLATDPNLYKSSGVEFSPPLLINRLLKKNNKYYYGNVNNHVCKLPLQDTGKIAKKIDVSFLGENLFNGFRSVPLLMSSLRDQKDKVLDYCAHYGGKESLLTVTRGADFIVDSSTLVKIAMTPYQQTNDQFAWSLNCFRVGKSIVISADNAAETTLLNDDWDSHVWRGTGTRELRDCYRLEKFIRHCCATNGEENFSITPEMILSRNGKCYRILKTYLSRKNDYLRIFYASEEHCLTDKNKPLHASIYDEGIGKGEHWPMKSLKWFLEALFSGAVESIFGLVSKRDSRLTRVVHAPIETLEDCKEWETDVCLAFLYAVLEKIRDFINLEELYTAAEFDYKLNISCFDEFFSSLRENAHKTRRETNVIRVNYSPTAKHVEFLGNISSKSSSSTESKRNDSTDISTSSILSPEINEQSFPFDEMKDPIPSTFGNNRKSLLSNKFSKRYSEELSLVYY